MNSAHNESGRFPSHEHDHRHCVASALDDAKAVCSERGARLTPVRRRVLEIIWQSHRPLGAYAILDVLSGEGHSRRRPPCTAPWNSCSCMVSCIDCHPSMRSSDVLAPDIPAPDSFSSVSPAGPRQSSNDAAIERAIERSAAAEGFTSQVHTVEISGICPHCREAPNAGAH